MSELDQREVKKGMRKYGGTSDNGQLTISLQWTNCAPLAYTVEPLNKGHFGANTFVPCREVVSISEVK